MAVPATAIYKLYDAAKPMSTDQTTHSTIG